MQGDKKWQVGKVRSVLSIWHWEGSVGLGRSEARKVSRSVITGNLMR